MDACKSRLKKLDEGPVKLNVSLFLFKFNVIHLIKSNKQKAEEDLRRAQTEFDRQSELIKALMDELDGSYVNLYIFFK